MIENDRAAERKVEFKDSSLLYNPPLRMDVLGIILTVLTILIAGTLCPLTNIYFLWNGSLVWLSYLDRS